MPFCKWVRVCKEGEDAWKQYKDSIADMPVEELLKEFFRYLDYKEETDSGTEFHPIRVEFNSSRIMMSEPFMLVWQMLNKKGR